MVLSESSDDALFKMHQDLCSKLNLDPNIGTTSWQIFENLNKKVQLEGEKSHWIGCSLYVASRSIETPTLDTSSVVKGMGINLTTLLRHSNLSVSQFFKKITRWADMAELPDDFRRKITNLDNNFSVAYNVFKSFHPLFTKIFVSPTLDMEASKHRNRKNRPIPCTPLKLFEFIWNMFIIMKSEETACSNQLIKAHHLLYCCIDLAFKNIVVSERDDLLISSMSEEILKYKSTKEVPCIVRRFCKGDADVRDALHMKAYIFKELLFKLIEDKTLIANKRDFTGIFDADNFDQNFRNFSKAYETHLLSHGDFDEKIFIAEHKRILLEKEQAAHWALPQSDLSDISTLESPRNSTGSVCPATPLTIRKYLGPRENDSADKSTSEKISRLISSLSGRTAGPSDSFKKLFELFPSNALEKIESIVSTLSDKFVKEYRLVNNATMEDAQSKVDITTTLFYKYVELICQRERSISADLTSVIDKDIFYQCTFACCLDMVLFCYNFPKKFPWSIEVLEIESIQFIKIIELVVRCKDNLFRELVKHLSRIEETVLESAAWESTSLIWQAIEKSGQSIPKYEEIALPGQLLYNDTSNEHVLQSPGGPLAIDCFQSPLSQVCKKLFPSAGQSVPKQTHLIVSGKDGNVKVIQLMDTGKKNGNQPGSPSTKPDPQAAALPKRTGGLAIIYRKFYNLAYIRINHLCANLPFADFDLKRKIWTIFEVSITHTDLIKDRHLDQLLMCAIYVICKACNVEPDNSTLFALIMKHYRLQPQASSSVYRDVLIEKKQDGGKVTEERGDLINFYNSVYVRAMQEYAFKFQPNVNPNNNIVLSPLPASRNNFRSSNMPVQGNVFVKPLETSNTQVGDTFNYYFSRSPSKDWKMINRAINNNGVQGKRLLTDEDESSINNNRVQGKRLLTEEGETPSSKKSCHRKIQSLVEDRRRQNAE